MANLQAQGKIVQCIGAVVTSSFRVTTCRAFMTRSSSKAWR